jgi:hypothetical protein
VRVRAASLLALVAAVPLGAQGVTAADLNNITIAVVVPRSNTMLTIEQKNQLGNTLLQAATTNGISAMGGPAGFQLTPMVTIAKEGEVGDLEKFRYVTLNIMVAVKQVPDNSTFASTSVILNGNGATREVAITEALNNLSPSDDRIIKVVDAAKAKIIQHYETGCDGLRADAKARAGTGHTEEAIALLMTVPREASTCQKAAGADAAALYTAWRDAQCDGIVRAARASLAERAFEAVVTTIERVDPASRCAKSADAVLADLEKRVAADHDFSLKVHAAIVTRTKVETSLASPGEATKHVQEQTVGVALGVVAKLPHKPQIIEHL